MLVTLGDDDGGTVTWSPSEPVLVQNVAPAIQNLNITPHIAEGEWVTLTADIFDPGLADVLTLVIDWGDGKDPQTISLPASQTTMWESHQYLDNSGAQGFNIQVTVSDGDNGSSAAAGSVIVDNFSPILGLLQLGDVVIDEAGTATLSSEIFDNGSKDSFTVTVVWGDDQDGDGVPDVSTYKLLAGATSLSEPHRYLDDNPTGTSEDKYTINVTLKDDDGDQDSGSAELWVVNVAPQLVNPRITSVDENGLATLSGTIADAVGSADTYSLTVTWGDKSTKTYQYSAGTTSFSETHQYLDDDPSGTPCDTYPVTLVLTDDDLGKDEAELSVTVYNVDPIIRLTQPDPINENGTATLNGLITDVGTCDTFTLQIDWGDGNWETASCGPQTDPDGFEFTYPHQYLDDNIADAYTITVWGVDDDGTRWYLATTTAVVQNVAPTAEFSLPLSCNEKELSCNEKETVSLDGTITDVGVFDWFRVSVNWGDSDLTEAQTIDLPPGIRSFSLTHQYLDDPGGDANLEMDGKQYLVTVKILDDDLGEVEKDIYCTVNNVAPEPQDCAVSGNLTEGGVVILTGSVVDPGCKDAVTLKVNWEYDENNPSDEGGEIYHVPGGTTEFTLTHTYDDECRDKLGALAPYKVMVTAEDEDGGKSSLDTPIDVKIEDVPPTLRYLQVTPLVDENSTISVNGTIVDPGTKDSLDVEVDWGLLPGEHWQPLASVQSPKTGFSGTMHYFDNLPGNEPYKVKVRITDSKTANDPTPVQLIETAYVTVVNVNPYLTGFTFSGVAPDKDDNYAGQPVVAMIWIDDIEIDRPFTGKINWGDGWTDEISATGLSLTPSHTYDVADNYNISVQLTDNDGGPSNVLNLTASVAPPPGSSKSAAKPLSKSGGGVSVSGRGAAEGGDDGVFKITSTADQQLTVTYELGDTATAGVDYLAAANGTITLNPGGSYELHLQVQDDHVYEGPERVGIHLLAATGTPEGCCTGTTNYPISCGTATITITDNDEPAVDPQPGPSGPPDEDTDGDGVPDVHVDSFTLKEGNKDWVYTLSVSLSGPTDVPITLNYRTEDDKATAGKDYSPVNGSITFPAGSTSFDEKTIDIPIIGDRRDEKLDEEDFKVIIVGSKNSSASATATITIVDDDDPPEVTGKNVSKVENDKKVPFPIELTAAADYPITVHCQAPSPNSKQAASATPDKDYKAAIRDLVFAKPDTQYADIELIDDLIDEYDEEFLLDVSSKDAEVKKSPLTGTILDNDAEPSVSISIDKGYLMEGNNPTTTTPMMFTITLGGAIEKDVTVDYAITSPDAKAGEDYNGEPATGTITFKKSDNTSQKETLTVHIKGDTGYEPNEHVVCTLSNPQGATLGTSSATGTIANDDQMPSLALSSASVVEPDTGSVSEVFTVTVSPPPGNDMKIVYWTTSGTATSDVDFTASTSGSINFPAGHPSAQITVPVKGDLIVETKESYYLTAKLADLPVGQGTSTSCGTIIDNDSVPVATNDIAVTGVGSDKATGIFVLQNDYDSKGRKLALKSIKVPPNKGTATITGDTIEYQADASKFTAGDKQPDDIVYVVSNGVSEAEAHVSVYLVEVTYTLKRAIPPVQGTDPSLWTNLEEVGKDDISWWKDSLVWNVDYNPKLQPGAVNFEVDKVEVLKKDQTVQNAKKDSFCNSTSLCLSGNPGRGEWELTPVVTFKLPSSSPAPQTGFSAAARDPNKRTVAEITKVQWVNSSSSADAGQVVCSYNGTKFYPDSTSPSSTNLRTKLDALITIEPKKEDIYVYLKQVDLDDPSESNVPGTPLEIDTSEPPPPSNSSDPAPMNTDDNLGAKVLLRDLDSKKKQKTDKAGQIRVSLTMADAAKPGDNVALVVAGLPNKDAGEPAQLARVHAKANEPANTEPGLFYDANANSKDDGTQEAINNAPCVAASQALTVWRTLHLEVDDMAAITNTSPNPGSPTPDRFQQTNSIVSMTPVPGVSFQYDVVLKTPLVPETNRYENGQLTVTGSTKYSLLVVSSTLTSVRVVMTPAVRADIKPGASVVLMDDDCHHGWALGSAIPPIPTADLKAALEEVYIDLEVRRGTIPFELNSNEAVVQDNWSAQGGYANLAYWSAYIASVFQCDRSGDGDPWSELAGAGIIDGITYNGTRNSYGSVVFVESIRETEEKSGLNFANMYEMVVVHEMGHQLASGEPPETNFTPGCLITNWDLINGNIAQPTPPNARYTKRLQALIRQSDRPNGPDM